jgi:geranylgeranyl reductase family protein
MIETNICIVGAGPGGAAAALKLDRMGIPSLLLDKAVFPRDKVCGDALSGKVIYGLNRIDNQLATDLFEEVDIRASSWGVKFVYPNTKVLNVPFVEVDSEDVETKRPNCYISKRIDFDNFLIKKVRLSPNVDFRESMDIRAFEKIENGWLLKNKKGETIVKTKMLLDASGALSRFSRKHGGIEKDEKHFAGGIRAYYTNVKGIDEFKYIEIYFEKSLTPGYLWIFPLPNGGANVGLGMRSDYISKGKVNLKNELEDILKNNPRFNWRFDEAVLEGKIVGYPLPLGSKKRAISGDNYLLIGDAASLIDPLSGEGIGNAVISGEIAAKTLKIAFEENKFDADFLKQYDKAIYQKMWKELKISYQLQQLMRFPWLVNIVSTLTTRNKEFSKLVTAMLTDVDLRKKFRSPRFYFKLLFNR